jgi:hypothetical protein
VGSDGNAPTDRPLSPESAEQADPVAQCPPTPENRSEAASAPIGVRLGARTAANDYALRTLGTGDLYGMLDTAIDATWAGAHQHLAEHYRAQGRQQAAGALAYETTCLRCVDQLDQLAAERAAGIAEGITGARDAAAELVADAAFDWTGETQRTIQAIAGRVRDMRLEAHAAAEPMHIADYQPSTETLDELMAQVGDDVRKLVADAEIPPNLIPPDGATSAAEVTRWQQTDPNLAAYRRRVEEARPGIERVMAAAHEFAPSEVGPSEATSNTDPGPVGASPAAPRRDRLLAQLDRALALLHDVLDQHWLDIPGSPPGQPGVMRIVDADRLTEWRQRMTTIEEATG